MSALDRIRAARAELTAAVRRADTNLSYERGLLNEVDRHLAQAEADLAREEKTGGRPGTTAAVPAQAPEPTDPGSTPGTGSPRPDVAALVARLRDVHKRLMRGTVTQESWWHLLSEAADALEQSEKRCRDFECDAGVRE